METLDSLRRQIETTRDLHGIVRTMKSLSAVSIRQYERAAKALENYEETVHLGLQALLFLRKIEVEEAATSGRTTAVILFGSEHGLCGRFNEDLIRFALDHLPSLDAPLAECRIAAVGGRVADRLAAEGFRLDEVLELPSTAAHITETAHALVARMEAWQQSGVGRVLLLHNHRGRAVASVPRVQELLPLRRAWLQELRDTPWPSRGLPSFRAPPRPLFAGLLRQHLLVALFRAVAESLASEHASRLASMEAAERNIEEHLGELQSDYRRSRQAAITEELLDIVAGFVSVGDSESTRPPVSRDESSTPEYTGPSQSRGQDRAGAN